MIGSRGQWTNSQRCESLPCARTCHSVHTRPSVDSLRITHNYRLILSPLFCIHSILPQLQLVVDRYEMTMDVSKSESNKIGSTSQDCAGCGKAITERYLLKALDMLWHEDCLKCGCCNCRLGELGSTLYTKANLILCKRDYLRLFGNTGYCAACSKDIPAFEMVMRARTNVYHLECFACQQCNHRFCVGDRFYLCENKILCEYDYEERLVFANMALHPPPTATLAHIKRQ
ncbi:LIM domain only protein 3-like isoform X3 [Cotesia glomerata]|nr:LIM domain only protein 3-like isoform X3 [Cotesia glomerata]